MTLANNGGRNNGTNFGVIDTRIALNYIESIVGADGGELFQNNMITEENGVKKLYLNTLFIGDTEVIYEKEQTSMQ